MAARAYPSRKITADMELGKQTIRWTWIVETTLKGEGPVAVVNAPELPSPGASYQSAFEPSEFMEHCRLRRYSSPKRKDNESNIWELELIYETPELKPGDHSRGGGGGRENPNEFDDPTQELPTVEMDVVTREEPITFSFDIDLGVLKPVTNSAGDPIVPPPKGPVKSLTLRIERNEPIDAAHPLLSYQYTDALNSDFFWGLPPGTWKCNKVKPKRMERQIRGGTKVPYLRVSYEFEAKQTHDLIFLDSGPNWLKPKPSAVTGLATSQLLSWTANLAQLSGDAPPAPAPGGANLAPSTFRIEPFKDSHSHPITRGLNGRGGPLPYPSTFTVSGGGLVVPAPPASTPGGYTNGLAVMVFCANGTLPTPLRRNTIYFTRDVSDTGLSFNLYIPGKPNKVIYRFLCRFSNGSTSLGVRSEDFGGTLDEWINTSMIVCHPAFPEGTKVTLVDDEFKIIATDKAATYDSGLNGQFVAFRGYEAAISVNNDGTGNPTIMPLGVYARLSRYSWMPFAPLGLPQSFADVQ